MVGPPALGGEAARALKSGGYSEYFHNANALFGKAQPCDAACQGSLLVPFSGMVWFACWVAGQQRR